RARGSRGAWWRRSGGRKRPCPTGSPRLGCGYGRLPPSDAARTGPRRLRRTDPADLRGLPVRGGLGGVRAAARRRGRGLPVHRRGSGAVPDRRRAAAAGIRGRVPRRGAPVPGRGGRRTVGVPRPRRAAGRGLAPGRLLRGRVPGRGRARRARGAALPGGGAGAASGRGSPRSDPQVADAGPGRRGGRGGPNGAVRAVPVTVAGWRTAVRRTAVPAARPGPTGGRGPAPGESRSTPVRWAGVCRRGVRGCASGGGPGRPRRGGRRGGAGVRTGTG